ncbi:hypothetical protein Wcon_00372 [Wolbachia endosymbiont of Cylisticus convexus]|uniref:hypothetical protein n=1 Tax=Wolbachia endosymbiont of Cylisticus convexus TaxID=118728 RepID=UPI000DF6FFA9|nr:hypothetical protein [Wolbachia endosymbiont of Cylisticus convexus]RDD35467.1 hypothetical protein Wcon_00372 [Wolbachia endosymbiont of Cylisticus convexus]
MANNIKELSNEAPIILTWVPRVRGASLPDGKNSTLNYLEIIKNHKLINKEERDIYLVINGPGFEENQIDDLKRELKGIKGVHVVDLHQYDWSEIDQDWKIDGKDISIKDFFRDMYNMQEEQRMYFAIEIDTFRLIALALLKQFTEHEGGIYIDFDSLEAINSFSIRRFGCIRPVSIGREIEIPMGILLGDIRQIFVRDKKGNELMYNDMMDIEDFSSDDEYKVTKLCANNDCIAIDSPDIVINILSLYKGKILTQKVMCQKIEEALSLVTEAKLDEEVSVFLSNEEHRNALVERKKENLKSCITSFKNNGIQALYNMKNFGCIVGKFNLAQKSVVMTISEQLIGEEVSKCRLFSFGHNHGNYVPLQMGNLSWTRGNDLYYAESNLEETEVDQAAMEKLSLA